MRSGPIIGFSIQVLVGQKYREPGDSLLLFRHFFFLSLRMTLRPFLLLLHPTSWAVHAFAMESWNFKACLVVNRRTWKGMSRSKGLQAASQSGRWVLCSFHFPFIPSFSSKEHMTPNGPVSSRRKWSHSLWIMVRPPDNVPLITLGRRGQGGSVTGNG